MSGVISRGHFGKALWPIVNAWFGKDYAERSPQYTMLFDTFQSRRAFEEDMTVSGLGVAMELTEGDAIKYDTMSQGFLTRYEMLTYALGFIVTRNAFEDDQANIVAPERARALAKSMRVCKEIKGTDVYNNAFDSNFVGGDGLELLSDVHVNKAGGTYSNEPSVAADFSEVALEQAVIDISKFTDDRGLQVEIKPNKLILPVELQFDAHRVMKSTFRVGTNDNDPNALMAMGSFPGGVAINHYLTDSNAWFVRTSTPGMKHWERRKLEFGMDNDFETENARFKATERYAFGWSDPKTLYGSPGT